VEPGVNLGDGFRIVVGLATVICGFVFLECGLTEKPLGVAVLVLGGFILFHWGVEALFMHVRSDYNPPVDSGMRDFASSFIATSGVILGLLALFGDKGVKLTSTLKVGVVALAADILLGLVLVGLLLAGADPGGTPTAGGETTQPDQKALNFIRIVFNVALWALSLGLLSIAMALIYR
jgi:hypothetical protein